MKQGLSGGPYAGCCSQFQVWGVHCNAPGNWPMNAENTWDHVWGDRIYPEFGELDIYGGGYPRQFPLEWSSTETPTNVTAYKRVIPELPEFKVQPEGTSWPMFAAKVPAIWPRSRCDSDPTMSSYHDDSWWASLGEAARHVHKVYGSEIQDFMATNRRCYGSRAIYVDGQQAWVSYNTSDWVLLESGGRLFYCVSRPYDWIGYHSIIPVHQGPDFNRNNDSEYSYRGTTFGGQPPSLGIPNAFASEDFDTLSFDQYNTNECNLLACAEALFRINTYFNLDGKVSPYRVYTWPSIVNVNNRYFGKDFFIVSSYDPKTCVVGTKGWSVGRLTYESSRFFQDGTEVPGKPRAFASPFTIEGSDKEPIGDIGVDSEGDYLIVLPSIRCYIDSSVIDPETHPHDECWVAAIKAPGAPAGPEIITAQWIDNNYRSGLCPIGQEDWKGAADGTLHSNDLASKNTILNTGDEWIASNFSSETWDDLRIWCYNRVYNPITRHSSDLLLITSQGPETSVVSDLVADFEDKEGESHDPNYLNHNLDQHGLSFSTSGTTSTSYWISDYGDHYGMTGENSAMSQISAVSEAVSQLELTINVAYSGYVNLYYKFDNRQSGARKNTIAGTETYEPTALTNFPEVDNTFKITLNGRLIGEEEEFSVITDPDGIPVIETGPGITSIIDNENLPSGNTYDDENFYLQWRKISFKLQPGTHTLRWMVTRKWVDDKGKLIARIDQTSLPQIMIGQDINSLHRWFFDGSKIRANPYWAWAKKNDEGVGSPGTPDPIDINRTSTVPNFITMSSIGRILMGNSHYTVCLKYNEDDDEWALDPDFGYGRTDGDPVGYGYLRLTATPNIPPFPEDCEDPDQKYSNVDILSDPPNGVFQILPTSDGGFQLRGGHGAMRDASDYPIDIEAYTYLDPRTNEIKQEKFKEFLTCRGNGYWVSRCCNWTISRDGKTRIPHVQVIWRPTREQMAWPQRLEDCTNPPYRADFPVATPISPEVSGMLDYGGVIRYRNPYAIDTDNRQGKTCWTSWNYIVPRTYCTTFSQSLQSAWMTLDADPPGPEDENSWYIPGGSLPDLRALPFHSARWMMHQLRFCPVSRWAHIFYDSPTRYTAEQELCEDSNNNPVTGFTGSMFFGPYEGVTNGAGWFHGFPDFDVVYDATDCCMC